MTKSLLSLMLFITFSGVKSQILNENFESSTFPPTGWTVESTNSSFTWKANEFITISGAKSAFIESDLSSNNQDENLITPSFSLVG